MRMTGTKLLHVTYKGNAQTLIDVMGGQITMMFDQVSTSAGHIKGGKLRGLGVTNGKRSPLAPDLPAIAEELKGYEVIAWFALVAPAKLPEAIVQRLNDANMKAMAKPDVKEKFALVGTDVAPMGPAEFGKFIQSEVAHWAQLVKLAGIEPE